MPRPMPPLTQASLHDTGQLFGVAATSAGNAWAVGIALPSSGPGKTLILRWNGTTWK